MLFLRDKLEAKSRELEKERAAKRHLASDLNRELDKMARQKEADVQAVRSGNLLKLPCFPPGLWMNADPNPGEKN